MTRLAKRGRMRRIDRILHRGRHRRVDDAVGDGSAERVDDGSRAIDRDGQGGAAADRAAAGAPSSTARQLGRSARIRRFSAVLNGAVSLTLSVFSGARVFCAHPQLLSTISKFE